MTRDSSDECANMGSLASAAALQIHEKQIQQDDQTQSKFLCGRWDKSVAEIIIW